MKNMFTKGLLIFFIIALLQSTISSLEVSESINKVSSSLEDGVKFVQQHTQVPGRLLSKDLSSLDIKLDHNIINTIHHDKKAQTTNKNTKHDLKIDMSSIFNKIISTGKSKGSSPKQSLNIHSFLNEQKDDNKEKTEKIVKKLKEIQTEEEKNHEIEKLYSKICLKYIQIDQDDMAGMTTTSIKQKKIEYCEAIAEEIAKIFVNSWIADRVCWMFAQEFKDEVFNIKANYGVQGEIGGFVKKAKADIGKFSEVCADVENPVCEAPDSIVNGNGKFAEFIEVMGEAKKKIKSVNKVIVKREVLARAQKEAEEKAKREAKQAAIRERIAAASRARAARAARRRAIRARRMARRMTRRRTRRAKWAARRRAKWAARRAKWTAKRAARRARKAQRKQRRRRRRRGRK
eukprot:NODE_575_length_1286_cov_170.617623_g414_i0.p1 GENE.NODE_575_length_1286_cov_170.617623_g414_i0~~NODE_575_length_1286_cov_170.617623_g414_i0.p1  ORF type:complete len:415 (+),score=5.53 NODE_575_length_1286_cov_170.617623_g414_i0:39-1247(+)